MKAQKRKSLKGVMGNAYFVNPDVDIADIDDDPTRRFVFEAIKNQEKSKTLLKQSLEAYLKYKVENFELPIAGMESIFLEPEFVLKAKNGKKEVTDYVPELFLDFIFNALQDYFDGVPLNTAFGLFRMPGAKTVFNTSNELEISLYFHDKSLEDNGYEYAVSDTANAFGISHKRAKLIYAKYKKLSGFDQIYKFSKEMKSKKFNVKILNNHITILM